jgi:hypothetical protein
VSTEKDPTGNAKKRSESGHVNAARALDWLVSEARRVADAAEFDYDCAALDRALKLFESGQVKLVAADEPGHVNAMVALGAVGLQTSTSFSSPAGLPIRDIIGNSALFASSAHLRDDVRGEDGGTSDVYHGTPQTGGRCVDLVVDAPHASRTFTGRVTLFSKLYRAAGGCCLAQFDAAGHYLGCLDNVVDPSLCRHGEPGPCGNCGRGLAHDEPCPLPAYICQTCGTSGAHGKPPPCSGRVGHFVERLEQSPEAEADARARLARLAPPHEHARLVTDGQRWFRMVPVEPPGESACTMCLHEVTQDWECPCPCHLVRATPGVRNVCGVEDGPEATPDEWEAAEADLLAELDAELVGGAA